MKKIKKASVLAYSLIVLSVMLMAAISISAVAIKDRNNVISSSTSVQSFQTANSGVNLVTKAMPGNSTSTLDDLALNKIGGGAACVVESGIAYITKNTTAEGTFKVEFYDNSGNPLTDCNATTIANVEKLKSIGSFKNTSRAVEVALAASGMTFQTFSHDNSTFSDDVAGCGATNSCKIDDLCNDKYPSSKCVSVLVTTIGSDQHLEDCATAYGTDYFATYTGFEYICAK